MTNYAGAGTVYSEVQLRRLSEITLRVIDCRQARGAYRSMTAIEQDRDDLLDLLELALIQLGS